MLLAASLAACSFAGPGGRVGGSVEVQDQEGDAMAAAGGVSIVGRVQGDVLAAAGDIVLTGDVAGDVRSISGEFRHTGVVSGEVSIAAGTIVLDGLIGDDLWAAGEDMELGPETRIGQDARLAAEDVLLRGRIDGDLDVAAEQIALDAQVGGDVNVSGRRLVIGPGATIDGALRWRLEEEPLISPEAIITGGVEGEVVERSGWRWRTEGSGIAAGWWTRLALLLCAFLAGGALIAGMPGFYAHAVGAVRRRVVLALGLGAGMALILATAALLLILSVLGAPLGLALFAASPLVLLFAYALAAGALGSLGLELTSLRRTDRPAQRLLALLAGLLALIALGFVPVLGALVAPLAIAAGFGAALLVVWTRRSF